jgi:1,4-dihydroxy-2-naphthoate octaprenyltransferase
MTQNVKSILGPMRVPFLILTPACVLLGAGTAFWVTHQLNLAYLIIVLVGAVSAHISVNALNEYFDFRSGLDLQTARTPFSGGSGTLPAQPEAARSALITGLVTLAITAAVGLFFLAVRGWMILPLGLMGLFLIFTYTFWLLRNPFASLIAPGLGFGVLMVMGTDFALTGQYSWTAFIASLTPFFLVSDLLLLNQFPDVEADRMVRRRHYPILIGRRASSMIYVGFLAGAYLAIVLGVALSLLPAWALLGLLTVVLAVPAARTAYQYADDIQRLVPAMGQNVLINILTPILMAVGLIVAGLQ